MIRPKRFSDEKKQELKSRSQLYERLVDFGWLPYSPEDLGEDFFVHVYYEGRAIGVAFYVQLKSVTNLPERKREESIIYPFPIKDLLHWEAFSYPVVLVVWDIILREGRWSLLSTALTELGRRKSTWRNNKSTASVKISWKNTFSDDGLISLRESVGKVVYPLISQGKSLDMNLTLDFSDTPKGRKARRDWERSCKRGEEWKIKKNVIKDIQISDWAKPWKGSQFDINKINELRVGFFPSKEIFLFDLHFWGCDKRNAVIRGIEFRLTKDTPVLLELSNEQQSFPLHFILTMSTVESCKGIAYFKNVSVDVKIAQEVLDFMDVFVSGGTLQLYARKQQVMVPLEIPVPPQPKFSYPLLLRYFVDALCSIQLKYQQNFQMPFENPKEEILPVVSELIMAVQKGKVVRRFQDLESEFQITNFKTSHNDLSPDKPIEFSVYYPSSTAKLFNQEINLGPIVQYISGISDIPTATLREIIQNHIPGQKHFLKLKDVETIVIFLDWVNDPENYHNI